MKNKIRTLLLLVFTLLLVKPTTIQADLGGFIIEHYDVNIVVTEEGEVTVLETIDVKFLEERHGLYFNIPTEYKIDNKKIVFPIKESHVLSNHDYSINYKTIKIGNSNHFASEREQYKISYTIQMKDLKLKEGQLFYWNIISNQWNEDIDHTTFTITMPKTIDEKNISFYTLKNTCSDKLKYTINDNVISGTLDEVINQDKALTVKMSLPHDYFKFPDNKRLILPYLIGNILLFIIIFVISTIKKKEDLIVKSIEFHPPHNVTSSDIGYIVDGNIENNDVFSLLLLWASQGFVSISESNKSFIVTLLDRIPNESPLSHFKFFNRFFYSEVIDIKKINGKKVGKGVYETKKNILLEQSDYFQKKNYKKFILLFISTISLFSLFMLDHQLFYGSSDHLISTMTIALFIIILSMLSSLIQLGNMGAYFNGSFRKTYRKRLIKYIIVQCIIFLITSIAMHEVNIVVTACFYIVYNCYHLLASSVIKRTEKGKEIYGKVLGFRNFIKTAEYDRLQWLTKENPNYFYEVLPYAYSFGLVDHWSKHFKNIDITPINGFNGIGNIDLISRNIDDLNISFEKDIEVPSFTFSDYVSIITGIGSDDGESGGGFGGTSGGSW